MEDINWNRLSREREREMRVEVGVKGQDKEFGEYLHLCNGRRKRARNNEKIYYYNKEVNKESRRQQKREFQGPMDGPQCQIF